MSALKQKAGGQAGSKTLGPTIVPRLLTVAEVSQATGFKHQTIYLWIAQRRLPVVRLGRSVRVPAEALAELIEASTLPARPEGGRAMRAKEFLDLLEGVARSGEGWMVRCPAHDDKHPSLKIDEGDNGGIVLHCFTGCTNEQIVTALGLQMSDLMSSNGHKRAPVTTPEMVWTIRDAEGRAIAEHHRIDLRSGKKKIWWTRNRAKGLGRLPTSDLPLYGSELVKDIPAQSEVYIVEGEKAADALRGQGLFALGTVTGAAGTPGRQALSALAGRRVILWADHDDAGRAHMDRIAEPLQSVSASVRLVQWGEQKGDDAADYFARGGTVEGLAGLVRKEPSAAELLAAIAVFIRRFVVLSKEQADAIALWVLHT